jgi:hypothetical protein
MLENTQKSEESSLSILNNRIKESTGMHRPFLEEMTEATCLATQTRRWSWSCIRSTLTVRDHIVLLPSI